MKIIALTALVILSACAGPRAPENPNSVPSVQQSIAQSRTSSNYIYITGGLNDGAAVGQTTVFIVTPDDRVLCTFQQDPVLPQDGLVSVVTGHRTVVAGAYAALSGLLLPNVTAQGEVFDNFKVESATNGVTSASVMGPGDPRFGPTVQYFMTTFSPCWSFG